MPLPLPLPLLPHNPHTTFEQPPAPQAKGLKKAKEVRTQLLDIMQQHKVPMVSCGNDWDTIRKVLPLIFFFFPKKLCSYFFCLL